MKEKRIKVIYKGEKTTTIPRIIFRCGEILSHGAVRCWSVLKTYAEGKEEAYPAMKTISNDMGISIVQVRKYVTELKSVGLIQVEKKLRDEGWGVFNIYYLADVKDWWKELGEALTKDRKKKKKKKYQGNKNLEKYRDSTG